MMRWDGDVIVDNKGEWHGQQLLICTSLDLHPSNARYLGRYLPIPFRAILRQARPMMLSSQSIAVVSRLLAICIIIHHSRSCAEAEPINVW